MQSDAIYDDKRRHRVRSYAPLVGARDHVEVSVVWPAQALERTSKAARIARLCVPSDRTAKGGHLKKSGASSG